jgi:glycine oxidase
MPLNPDVLVVGGGVIGASCARALAAAGAEVTLIERPGTVGAAWRASAGMLAAQVEAQPDDPLLELALAGREFFRTQASELDRTTGINIAVIQSGILQVVRRESDVEAIKERVGWQRQQALRADWLDAEEVAERWPWLGECRGAFWSPEDGAVDPDKLVAAFISDATRLGTRIVADTVVGLDHDGARVHGVIGERQRYAAGTVVIAAGAWSGRLQALPRPLSVEPVRGQMMAFPWPVGVPPAIVYGEGCYLLQRGTEMLVGATVEHAGFDSSVTPAGLADLHERASLVYPPLAGLRPSRSWAGLRPGTPDGLPIIGAEPRVAGLWYATGHGRNGVLLSGITGELIARGVCAGAATDELHPFRPARFWNW